MQETSELAATVARLHRTFDQNAWTTPVELRSLRENLAERLRRGDNSTWTVPIEFPAVDVGPVLGLCDQALSLTRHLEEDLQRLVVDDLTSIRMQAAAIHDRSDDALVTWSQEWRGLPSTNVLEEAKAIVRTPVASKRPPTEDASAVAQAMREALEEVGVTDWIVEIVPSGAAKVSVSGPHHRVSVRDDIKISEWDKHRLVVHEIGGHVLRWVDARRQPEPLAALALGNTVSTEEGLAVLGEHEHGFTDSSILRTYAVRVLGVEMGQRLGMIDLAFALHQWLDADEAAALTLRLRRGIRDPHLKGCMTKDHGYLTGLRALHTASAEDVCLLRGVKWPMASLPVMRRLRDQGRLVPSEPRQWPMAGEFSPVRGDERTG